MTDTAATEENTTTETPPPAAVEPVEAVEPSPTVDEPQVIEEAGQDNLDSTFDPDAQKDFMDGFDGDDPDDVDPPEQVEETPSEPAVEAPVAPEPVTETPAETPPVEAPPAVEAPAVVPEPAPVAPETLPEPVTAAPSPEPVEPITQEQVQAQFEAVREQHVTELTKHYTLSEEMAEKFDEEPAAVMPVLLANAHHSMVNAAVQQVVRMMPAMVGQIQTQTTQGQQSVDAFVQQWPEIDLKNPVHEQTVKGLAVTMRGNPEMAKLAPGDFLKQLGAAAMLTLGLERNPVAPVAPVDPPPAPHVPAGASAPTGGAPRKPKTQADIMLEQFEAEDADDFDA